jgi:hypothetical protein
LEVARCLQSIRVFLLNSATYQKVPSHAGNQSECSYSILQLIQGFYTLFVPAANQSLFSWLATNQNFPNYAFIQSESVFSSMQPIRVCLLNPGTNQNNPSPLLQPIRCCRLMPECGQIRQAQYGA